MNVLNYLFFKNYYDNYLFCFVFSPKHRLFLKPSVIRSVSKSVSSLQDPEVRAAFQDVAQNPANMAKYQDNPKVMNLLSKLSAKFGAPPQP